MRDEAASPGDGLANDVVSRVEAALERFEDPLMRYATHLLGDSERARDVVQEVFLELCRRGPAGSTGDLGPWLFTVCRHRALDQLRKERRMVQVGDERLTQARALNPSPSDMAEQQSLYARVLRAVDKLPLRQQEVLRLRFLGELSYREISQVTGLSETNVGYLIHTAIASLRQELAGERLG